MSWSENIFIYKPVAMILYSLNFIHLRYNSYVGELKYILFVE
jgi:hypothetical protein